MKTKVSLALLTMAAVGVAQTAPQTSPVRQLPPDYKSRDPFRNSTTAHSFSALEAGQKAETLGNFNLAERRYREHVEEERNGAPFAHIHLAKLFDRMGRDREAYAEYRRVVIGYGDNRGWSSDQQNPVVLARYGDLARHFGTVEEARHAYEVASLHSTQDDVWEPTPKPRTASLASLRAAAHTSAACTLFGWPTQEQELRTAIEADPSYWVPHYYLAQILPWKRHIEAAREARLAASMAPTKKYQAVVAPAPFFTPWRLGVLAERKGDDAEAERQYRAVVETIPNAPIGYSLLARLYDKQGRERDAYEAWRHALAKYEPAASSMRDDPGPLAHYGDLAARFGSAQEATEAYALAVAACDRDDVWEPRPVPREDTFTSLKAAAHTAASIKGALGGALANATALKELELALDAEPQLWTAHYYRAYILVKRRRMPEAVREAALAERLATPKGRRQVRWMRAARSIPDASGKRVAIPSVRKSGSWTSPPDLP